MKIGGEEESEVQNDSPTAAKSTLRVFFAVTANNKWKCETIDVKAAFLQGKKIERDIFVMPPPDAREIGIIWKLEKVVYGLDDASRNWYFSVKETLLELVCLQSKLDKSLFRWYEGEILQGIFLMHVDDFLFAGSNNFRKFVINNLMEKYKMGKHQGGDFKYVG